MESKSKACIATSLTLAFLAMLVIAVAAHAVVHGAAGVQVADTKSFESTLPVVETAFNWVTVGVWGLVAGAGAAVKTGASYLLSHHR